MPTPITINDALQGLAKLLGKPIIKIEAQMHNDLTEWSELPARSSYIVADLSQVHCDERGVIICNTMEEAEATLRKFPDVIPGWYAILIDADGNLYTENT